MIIIPIAAATLVILVALVWVLFKPNWMGLRGKTLWDWIVALSFPVTMGLGAMTLSAAQISIQGERAREAAVQQYIDRVSALVTNGITETEMAVGKAQTGAIFRLVDGDRVGRILLFLSELDLLRAFEPNLEFVDLRSSDLKGMPFSGVDFEGSDLRYSELEGADLSDADFEDADLRSVDFKDAKLQSTNFERARINRADFDHADLRGADLSGVFGAKSGQLSIACLDDKTKLPADVVVSPSHGTGCEGKAEDDD
jgi:hypothetical protein